MNLMKQYLKHLNRQKASKRAKTTAFEKSSHLDDNALADLIRKGGDSVLNTDEWRALRRKVLDTYGRKCMCCGSEPKDRRLINIDHIKPRRFFPELTYVFENLQVLCQPCNKSKGNKHSTDYRIFRAE